MPGSDETEAAMLRPPGPMSWQSFRQPVRSPSVAASRCRLNLARLPLLALLLLLWQRTRRHKEIAQPGGEA